MQASSTEVLGADAPPVGAEATQILEGKADKLECTSRDSTVLEDGDSAAVEVKEPVDRPASQNSADQPRADPPHHRPCLPQLTFDVAEDVPPTAADASCGTSALTPRPTLPHTVASDRFRLEERLGQGSFGEVWRGIDCQSGNVVAVKLELKSSSLSGTLVNEYELMHDLKIPCKQQGFADLFYFGREGDFVYMVMEFLPKSLQDCLQTCGGCFNLKTVVLLADQMLRRLEYLHSKCIIHRDIKPENFMMGADHRAHVVYLIDFGLSEVYFHRGNHFDSAKASLTGTALYSSVRSHGHAQSRRDDLESLGYVLIYFIRGTLPWFKVEKIDQDSKDDIARVYDCKQSTKLETLCHGLPDCVKEYMRGVRSLSYRQRPNYNKFRRFFWQTRQAMQPPCQDHDLQWLEDSGITPEDLIPIPPWPGVAQPDDGVDACRCFRRCVGLRQSTIKDEE
mmetsp:Transcript_57747/g.161026  ORF Transcript_57747/g.161026 Transcript_57747/m.161026 type:complete len:451 (-) Transcript_57747:76-1428(-)